MKNIYQKIPIGIMHVIVTSVIVIASGCSCTSENEIFMKERIILLRLFTKNL